MGIHALPWFLFRTAITGSGYFGFPRLSSPPAKPWHFCSGYCSRLPTRWFQSCRFDKLRLRLVVCDTKIEGRGSWRDLLKGRDADPSFAPIVVSRHASEALWAEVRNLGGFCVLEKPGNSLCVGQPAVAKWQPAGLAVCWEWMRNRDEI